MSDPEYSCLSDAQGKNNVPGYCSSVLVLFISNTLSGEPSGSSHLVGIFFIASGLNHLESYLSDHLYG